MKRNDSEVVVAGNGRLWIALGVVLARQGIKTTVWTDDKAHCRRMAEKGRSDYLPDESLPNSLVVASDLEKAIAGAPRILISTPSKVFRSVVQTIGAYIQGDQLVVHATRGFERKTFKTMNQILREESCTIKCGVLAGPTIAEQLLKHPTGSLLASRFPEVIKSFKEIFQNTNLRIYGGDDIIGAEVGGAFKNILSIAIGMCDGLGFGTNTRALLITRGLNEMVVVGIALGAKMPTFIGLSGVGDLLASGFSEFNPNYYLGKQLLAKGKTRDLSGILAEQAEGMSALEAVYEHAQKNGLSLPIVKGMYELLFAGKTPGDVIGDLLAFPADKEFDID